MNRPEGISPEEAPLDLVRECARLLLIVDGLEGDMEHGTWRDENGMRLKDTKAWVRFYVATKDAIRKGA